MDRRALTLVFSLAAGNVGATKAQQLPFRNVRIASCPSADTIIGKMKDDWDGRVYGFYSEVGDSTLLWSGSTTISEDWDWWVSAGVRFSGRAPMDYPRPVLGVMLRGAKWHRVLTAATPPPVILVLDDSITLSFAPPLLGRYQGPEQGVREIIPLSVSMTDVGFAGVARAKTLALRVGADQLVLGRQDRHDLRALFRVATCHVPIVFGEAAH